MATNHAATSPPRPRGLGGGGLILVALAGTAVLGLMLLLVVTLIRLRGPEPAPALPSAGVLPVPAAPATAPAAAGTSDAAGSGAPAVRPLPDGGPSAPPLVTTPALVENPGAYMSMIVSTRGAITEIVSAHAFVLDGTVLVLSTSPLPDALGRPPAPQVYRSDTAHVIGAVRSFNVLAAQQELGVALDEAKLAPWAGKPAVYATHLKLVP